MQVVECGTACLTMIANYYGKRISLSQCRDYCDSGRDGVSALKLVKAGRKLGFEVRAFTVKNLTRLETLQFPLIAHWGFNHFVVVESFSQKKVRIVDPGIGRKTLRFEEFSTSFTGVAILYTPGKDFECEQKPEKSFWYTYFVALIRERQIASLFAQTVVASFFMLLAGLVSPIFTKLVIDSVLPNHAMGMLNMIGLGLILMAFAHGFLVFLRARVLIFLRSRIDIHLAFDFFLHLLHLPFRFFQLRSSGDLMMRLGSVSVIRETLTSQIISVFLDGLLVFVYLAILAFISLEVTLIVLVIASIEVFVLTISHRKNRNLTQAELTARSEEQGYLVEALKSMMIIKATGSEENSFNQWTRLFYNQLSASINRSILITKVNTLVISLGFIAPFLILWVNAHHVLEDAMTVGSAIAITSLASSTLLPISTLFSTGLQLQSVVAHLDRLKDVFEQKQEDRSENLIRVNLNGNIEIRNLNFRYTTESSYVLNDINLLVGSGQKASFVGPTASGKSSLVSLVLGLNTDTEGEILFDGKALNSLDVKSVRKQIGVVLQDPYIFGGSIRQNICMG